MPLIDTLLSLDTFAKRLLTARVIHELTQYELAALCGTHKHYISRLERGDETERVSVAVLKALGKALGVTTDWLLYGRETDQAE